MCVCVCVSVCENERERAFVSDIDFPVSISSILLGCIFSSEKWKYNESTSAAFVETFFYIVTFVTTICFLFRIFLQKMTVMTSPK